MNIRNIYLYLFSFIGLLITVFGLVQIVDLALNVFIFEDADLYGNYPRIPVEESQELTEAEESAYQKKLENYSRLEQSRNRKRQLSNSISMIVVGLPLYYYHWKIISREKREQEI